jgi:hypothetical protein
MKDPIYTAIIGGKPLRFFPSPVGNTDPDWYFWEEGCGEPKPELPDFPWLALEDLMVCLDLPLDQRERILRDRAPPARIVTIKDFSIRDGQPTDHELPCTQSITVADGIVVIAPQIIVWSISSGLQWMNFRKPYEIAYRAALDAVTAGLSVHELKEWLKGADKRWHLNYLAMGTERRGDNETTWHGLTILGHEAPTEKFMI